MTDEYFSVPDSIRDPLIIEIKDQRTGEVKKKVEVFSAESFCGLYVAEQKITGYKNVSSAVRVSLDYCGCCSSIDETTYLLKENGGWIPLPEVNYFTCDWPEEKPAYKFKNSNEAVVQEIQFVTEYRNDQGDLYKSKMLDTYTWNGKFIVKKKD
jgi:hypothetical protein